MVNKRGQLTIFVIVGVVVVLGIILFVIYKGNSSDKYFEQPGVSSGVSEIKDYMVECVKYVSDDSLMIVQYQGGYYTAPSKVEEYGESFIPYYSYDGAKYFPNLDSIEGEMGKAVDDVVGYCVEYAEFTGYDVSYNTVHTNVNIGDNSVEFIVDMPITIETEGHKMILNMKEYPVVIPSKIKGMHNVAQYLVDDLSDDSTYCVNCLGEIAQANNVHVDVLGLDETTSSVILSDDSSSDGNYTYYIFLNKFKVDSLSNRIEIPEGYD